MSTSYDDEKDKPDAPTMVRSRGQLSSSYAPGAFFTFEGGLGACIAQPDYNAATNEADIGIAVKDQILMRFDDAVKTWFDTAMKNIVRQPNQPEVMPEQCVDSALLNHDYNALRPLDRSRYVFVNPGQMGYAPAPLTFVCNHCGRFHRFENAKDFAKNARSRLKGICKKTSNPCQWRQLDVIFVHWSGRWEPVRPGKWDWDGKNNKLRDPIDRCKFCHQSDFILETAHSQSSIGKWYFRCGNCGNSDQNDWIKNDPDSIDILKEKFIKYPAQARMEPISYRASAAYYAQSDQFILFDENQAGLLSYLDIAKHSELVNFIGSHFGYGRSRPSIGEIEIILNQTEGGKEQWESYKKLEELLNVLKEQPGMSTYVLELQTQLDDKLSRWFTEGNPPLLKEQPKPNGTCPQAMPPPTSIPSTCRTLPTMWTRPPAASSRSPFTPMARSSKRPRSSAPCKAAKPKLVRC